MTPRPRSALPRLPNALVGLLALVLVAGAARAQVAKQGNDTLSSLVFQSERLAPSQPIEALDDAPGAVSFVPRNMRCSTKCAIPDLPGGSS